MIRIIYVLNFLKVNYLNLVPAPILFTKGYWPSQSIPVLKVYTNTVFCRRYSDNIIGVC